MQVPSFRKFLYQLTVYTIILIGISILIFWFILPQYYLKNFPILLLLFYLVNAGFGWLMEVYGQKRQLVMVRAFLAGWTLKFFIYIIFLLVVVLIDRGHALNFLAQFSALYIAYTTFEIGNLIRNFKNPVRGNNL